MSPRPPPKDLILKDPKRLRDAIADGMDVNAAFVPQGSAPDIMTRPLHYVAERGLVEQTRQLLSAGASVFATVLPFVATPMHEAVRQPFNGVEPNPAIIKLLAQANYNVVDMRDSDGWTPLHIACSEGYPDIVRTLIACGANFDAANPLEWDEHPRLTRALHLACKNNTPEGREIVRLLLAAGAYLNCQARTGETPLHIACEQDDTVVAERLINAGADVNALQGSRNTSVLQTAIRSASISCVKQLLDFGADTEHRELHSGLTALHMASVRPQFGLEMVEALVEQGACIDVVDEHGDTPLIHAIESVHFPVVNYLLAAGADPTLNAGDGRTPGEVVEHAIEKTGFSEEGNYVLEHIASLARRAMVESLEHAQGRPADPVL